MEAQFHGQDPHDIAGLHSGEGEHNQPGEKKSVLTKVKDKAKKFKDTIKKHGHGQEHENRHDQISEEEDVDDEDMVNAPEVHGAPMYESPVKPGRNLPIQTDVNLEKPTNTRDSPNVRNEEEGVIRPSGPGKLGAELERSSVEARRPEFENQLPQSSPANVAEPMVQISPLIGLEEDPHSPKIHPGKIPPSNYQSKVTDPSGEGGKEADVALLLDNFHIHDQSESNPNPAPEQKSVPESNIVNPSENPDSTIAGKIFLATSAIAGKAVSAKDMVASKLGYGGQPQDGDVSSKKPVTGSAPEQKSITRSHDQFVPESNPVNPSENPNSTIAGKISSATSAIAGKAVSAKDMVASKLGYGGQPQDGDVSSKKPVTRSAPEQKSITGSHDQSVPESNPVNPSENPNSTIAVKISSATSAIAGKAVSAKDIVASKLGYGGQPQDGEGGGGDTVAEGAERGASLKEYLVEKSRPGEEDKALSEAIREIFYKKKEGMQGKEEEVQPVGRVMEPEQEAAGSESSGGGVVDRLKGAVGAWLGKSSGTGSVDHSLGQSHVSDAGSVPGVGVGQSKEEIGLQESGN